MMVYERLCFKDGKKGYREWLIGQSRKGEDGSYRVAALSCDSCGMMYKVIEEREGGEVVDVEIESLSGNCAKYS